LPLEVITGFCGDLKVEASLSLTENKAKIMVWLLIITW
jgi:hypothetical protein